MTRACARRAAALLAVAVALPGCLGNGRYLRHDVQACLACEAPGELLDQRVVLIGDAGENYGDTPALRALSRVAGRAPERTLVLYLGDNVYPAGLPSLPGGGSAAGAELAAERSSAEEALRSQMLAVERAGAEGVLVPGNHDWGRGAADGLARVREQQSFVAAAAADPARLLVLPRDGCPGPMVLDRGRSLRVIVVDTDWLLAGDRARGEQGCTWGDPAAARRLEPAGEAGFFEALREAVEGAGERKVLFAAHHPFKTRGPHGGYFTTKDLVFPLTKLAPWAWVPLPFLYPMVRYWVTRSPEDLVGGDNEAMRRRLQEVLLQAARPPTIAAAGHEHSLQVLDDDRSPILFMVSGAGAKTEPVGKTGDTLFKDRHLGFMVLDYFTDGRISLHVVEPTGPDEHETVLSMWVSGGEGVRGKGIGSPEERRDR